MVYNSTITYYLGAFTTSLINHYFNCGCSKRIFRHSMTPLMDSCNWSSVSNDAGRSSIGLLSTPDKSMRRANNMCTAVRPSRLLTLISARLFGNYHNIDIKLSILSLLTNYCCLTWYIKSNIFTCNSKRIFSGSPSSAATWIGAHPIFWLKNDADAPA